MATSNPYSNGLKKPLNMLENPVYPDIKKPPPRFVWSRKHWTVDTGATLMSTEPITQLIEHAVLAQSRDYNQTIYGQSSHKDNVNAEFRPPLISYYEDIGPLTRVPTKIAAIVPRDNPGTAFETGSNGYVAKNERPSSIEKSLTDRVKKGDARPTFYAPIETPIDNSVLPDLEIKLPATSLTAGWTFNYKAGLDPKEIELREKLSSLPLSSGISSSVRITGRSDLEGYQPKQNIPTTSVFSGITTNVKSFNQQVEDFEFVRGLPAHSVDAGKVFSPQYTSSFENTINPLEFINPQTSVDAGKVFAPQYTSSFENTVNPLEYHHPQTSVDAGKVYNPQYVNNEELLELDYHNPQVSVGAGYDLMPTNNIETPIHDLDYHNPQVAVGAGQHYSYNAPQTPVDYNFEEKLSTPLVIVNPGTADQTHIDMDSYSKIDDNQINQKHMNVSYEVTKEIPIYRDRNVLTRRDKFTQKLQPEKFGSYSQTGNSMPKFGIEIPQQYTKEKRTNKYIVNKKKPMYKI